MPEAAPDGAWIDAQRVASARELRRATSATGLSHTRRGFGWTVRPAAGSILASPVPASWDPAPDYFHHWQRDAAIALRAVPLAVAADPGSRDFWRQAVADHVAFTLAITDPARRGPARNPLRGTADAAHMRFLRDDAELAALSGDDWMGEPRVAADGGPDLEDWSRPQDDGPATRASTLMALQAAWPEVASDGMAALLARDLAYVARVAGRACIGPWEEAPARRTIFTLIAEWDALDRGHARTGDPALRAAADRVAGIAEGAADPATGGWKESVEAAPGRTDAAAVLAVLHAGRRDGPFALDAPRTRATVEALCGTFAALYPVGRPDAPAIGRWAEDVYFDGHPWLPTTLGFAELHYRLAAAGDGAAFDRAEAWMRLVQDLFPAPGPLPEQFHRETGVAVSCPALTWSAAAFLEAAAARDAALQAR